MSTPNQPLPHLNEAQQRINNILMSDSFILISGTGEVFSQNISMQALWSLLESVKFSLLSQFVNFCLDQRSGARDPGAQD